MMYPDYIESSEGEKYQLTQILGKSALYDIGNRFIRVTPEQIDTSTNKITDSKLDQELSGSKSTYDAERFTYDGDNSKLRRKVPKTKSKKQSSKQKLIDIMLKTLQ